MLYARLIAEQLASTTGKIDFASVGALPAGLDEIYAENFRRVFVDEGAWGDALPLIELICSAAEPLTIDVASAALDWDRDRCAHLCAEVSLLFPLREGDVIGVLHKTVTDWLTGEAPFDKRCSEDSFFVRRDAAHRQLARACARSIRAKVLDTASYSSDAAADEMLAIFVDGEGGVASAAYTGRWCLHHMNRSGAESEGVAVACALSFVCKRIDEGAFVALVSDLAFLVGRDVSLMRDALVLSQSLLLQGAALVDQLSQRLTLYTDVESSPAARRLADDAERATRNVPLSIVRPILKAAGGTERCRIEMQSDVQDLATFIDPATGSPRLAIAVRNEGGVFIHDPVVGGAPLFVIEDARAPIITFVDPATGAPRLASYFYKTDEDSYAVRETRKLCVWDLALLGAAPLIEFRMVEFLRESSMLYIADLAAGLQGIVRYGCPGDGIAAWDIETGVENSPIQEQKKHKIVNDEEEEEFHGNKVEFEDSAYCSETLVSFTDPATNRLRLAGGQSGRGDSEVRIWDAFEGGAPLLVLETGLGEQWVSMILSVFTDQSTGAPRLLVADVEEEGGTWKIFDPVAGGAPLVELEEMMCDRPLVLMSFFDSVRAAPCLAGVEVDGKIQVWNLQTGSPVLAATIKPPGGRWESSSLAVFTDPSTGAPQLAIAFEELSLVCIYNPDAQAAAAHTSDEPQGHTKQVLALVSFVDPATGALRLATGSEDGHVRLWDASTTGNMLAVVDLGSPVIELAIFTDPAMGAPRLVCVCGSICSIFRGERETERAQCHLWNLIAGETTPLPEIEQRNKRSAALQESSDEEDEDGESEHQTVGRMAVFVDPRTGAHSLAIAGARSEEIGFWGIYDPADGSIRHFVLGEDAYPIIGLAVFADSATGEPRIGVFASGMKLWVCDKNGDVLFKFDSGIDQWAWTGLVFSLAGATMLASAMHTRVCVWDIQASGAPMLMLEGHAGAVEALAMFEDPATNAARLVSGSRDMTVRLWDLRAGGAALQVIVFKAEVRALAVAEDGRLLFGVGTRWTELQLTNVATPLGIACCQGDLEAIKSLLDGGANSDDTDGSGSTPLLLACQSGYIEAARTLLDCGAAVDRGRGTLTPVSVALWNGHVDVARLLFERGAAELADSDGSILAHVCACGFVEAARMLLNRGSLDVNRSNAHDRNSGPGGRDPVNGLGVETTPLWIASQNGHVETVELLLERGEKPEPNRSRWDYKQPRDAAEAAGHWDIVARLDLATLIARHDAEKDEENKKDSSLKKVEDHTAVRDKFEQKIDALQRERIEIQERVKLAAMSDSDGSSSSSSSSDFSSSESDNVDAPKDIDDSQLSESDVDETQDMDGDSDLNDRLDYSPGDRYGRTWRTWPSKYM